MSYVSHEPKRKRYRFCYYVNQKRNYINVPDSISRGWYRELEALIESLEQMARAGERSPSKETWNTLKSIRETNQAQYDRILNTKCFEPLDSESLTLSEAFDNYIAMQGQWRERTIANWKNTKARIAPSLGSRLVRSITLTEMQKFYESLRGDYSPATLEKDCKNIRQLWKSLKATGEIDENVLKDFSFALSDSLDRVADKSYIGVEWFVDALNSIAEKYIQQRTLFAYYRWMGARQSDPKGDTWEDVDLDSEIATVVRYCGKKRRKIGVCPIEANRFPLRQMLAQYKAHVIREKGEATGPLFPWLTEVTPSRQFRFFRLRMEQAGVLVWPEFFNSLRASRVVEIRQLPNGRKLEEMIIGHSAEVADLAYHPKVREEKNYDTVTKLFFQSFAVKETVDAVKCLTVDEKGKEVA